MSEHPWIDVSGACASADAATAEIARLRAALADMESGHVAMHDEVKRLSLALAQAERERDEARTKLQELEDRRDSERYDKTVGQ